MIRFITKKIIVKVQSGMCNRLIPFVTGLRLSDLLKSEFFLYWDDNCRDTAYNYKGEKTLYNDMFEKIENVNYIEKNEFSILYSKESKGFSPFKDEDPFLCRIIAKKM